MGGCIGADFEIIKLTGSGAHVSEPLGVVLGVPVEAPRTEALLMGVALGVALGLELTTWWADLRFIIGELTAL
jgi:hypothetical protein